MSEMIPLMILALEDHPKSCILFPDEEKKKLFESTSVNVFNFC
jgi:hypothetical protein